jgi:HKD family nuclease
MEKKAVTLISNNHYENIKWLIDQAAKQADECRLAVAFWGEDAVEKLGLTKGIRAKIICDLDSGACNPEVVRELRKNLGNKNVKKLPGLHAKLYWTPCGLILGSSNASANGLGYEGKEVVADSELNVLVYDEKTIKDAGAQFQKWWKDDATDIDDDDIERIESLWRSRRGRRGRKLDKKTMGLIEAHKKSPDFFKDRDIWVYKFKSSPVKESEEQTEYEKSSGVFKNASKKYQISQWYDDRKNFGKRNPHPYSPGRKVLEIKSGKLSICETLDRNWKQPVKGLEGYNYYFYEGVPLIVSGVEIIPTKTDIQKLGRVLPKQDGEGELFKLLNKITS